MRQYIKQDLINAYDQALAMAQHPAAEPQAAQAQDSTLAIRLAKLHPS
jgi:hypothetical protein